MSEQLGLDLQNAVNLQMKIVLNLQSPFKRGESVDTEAIVNASIALGHLVEIAYGVVRVSELEEKVDRLAQEFGRVTPRTGQIEIPAMFDDE